MGKIMRNQQLPPEDYKSLSDGISAGAFLFVVLAILLLLAGAMVLVGYFVI